MPVIKIYADPRCGGAAAPPFEPALARLADEAVTTLGADPDLVQILWIAPLAPVHGSRVYVEANFRAKETRTPAAVERLMDAIDRCVQACVGEHPRIRCYAEEAAHLYARR
ncbi:MAG: hypothetical protein KGL18_12485 [Burkholderiales bacterium]|nr:hypothetical protein [Burkholderiales bacterium]MDE2158660.1 hypothetical protein [Burkholderiales bacterium]MDE2503774.1 hypothetical protein [Burkholderiales bacterium]